jgi:UDP-2-acetamido-3-amino-2,3-dideoxy-glucuronate N-acetyltransferase
MSFWAHETAVVDVGAVIGDGTRIWHFCYIMKGAQIGKHCTLGQNVMVASGAILGDGVKLQNNVSVYDGVRLDDGVFCGPSCVFTNVLTPRAFLDRKQEFGSTRVRSGATIGANSTIVCGAVGETTELGAYCFIAAGATVTNDVLPHALVAGTPARQIGWVSRAGEVLGADLRCRRSGEVYAINEDRLQIVRRARQCGPHLDS